LTNTVEVVLAITVEVDDEYSSDQHAEDIVFTAKRAFPAAKVNLLNIDIGDQSEPNLGEPVS